MPATRPGAKPRKWRRASPAERIRGLWFALIIGALPILYGVWSTYRDRPSLQWPKVSGEMMQAEWRYVTGARHGHYEMSLTYVYSVNNQRYVGDQFALWEAGRR
jgi:hypothetical protein